jgi:CBS domain-containing protein
LNEYVFRYHHRIFPVVDGDRFVGMIDVRAVKNVPADKWPTTRIDQFLYDPSKYCILDPDMAATDALRHLTMHSCSNAPVVRDGALLGILTRSDLFKLASLKKEIAA